MADKKISALDAATLPLAGTEVLPIVQAGTTDKITVNNLAAGNLKSQSTTGVLQVSGPADASIRVATVPNANWTAARTDAAQTFTGVQTAATFRASSASFATQLQSYRLDTLGGNSAAGTVELGGGNASSASANVSYARLRSISVDNTAGAETGKLQAEIIIAGANTTVGTWSGLDYSVSGNFIPATAAKGVNFTANTPAAGMTSQLLNWYEEGTWTPNQGAGLTVVGTFSSVGYYVKVGKSITVNFRLASTTSIAASNVSVLLSNLPFSVNSDGIGAFGVGVNAAGTTTFNHQATGTSIYLEGSNIAATTNIYGSVTYITT
jgi:hypothetical protein